jgi:hypothetical protein
VLSTIHSPLCENGTNSTKPKWGIHSSKPSILSASGEVANTIFAMPLWQPFTILSEPRVRVSATADNASLHSLIDSALNKK